MPTEREYWDMAATDPEVAIKYISDISTEECYEAIKDCFLVGAILDIGCGIGRLSNLLAKNNHGCHVVGIDISQNMLDIAQKNNPEQRVIYKITDGHTIPFKDNYFRSAYSVLTFQHIDDENLKEYIIEVYRVLENNGVFRFQYVEGEHNGFVDHNHSESHVTDWLKDTGFGITKIDRGLIHPQWTWITGVKV